MSRSVAVLFEVFALISVTVSRGQEVGIQSQTSKEVEYDVVRRKRAFGNSAPPCNRTNGVYLERWDRIDYKRIRFLLEDPRYPNLPSFTTCVPIFEQPANWGDFFGSRLRTYFVPLQTGNHYFFLSSNGGSELYLSTDDKPDDKTKIVEVDGGFPSEQYEYDRFTNQKSLPVSLKKGLYYYMEAIMKDDHQWDHLEVALQTPDGKFYKVIPSQFLWTTNHPSAYQNAIYQATILKVAAKAGAKAGSSFGARWAMKTGAQAGANAGAMAGMEAGASAGARAGEKAAAETTTKMLEDALNTLHGDNLHKFKIILENGSVIDVIGPGMGGSEAAGSTGGANAMGAGINGGGGRAGTGSTSVGGAGGGTAMGGEAGGGEGMGGVAGGGGGGIGVGVAGEGGIGEGVVGGGGGGMGAGAAGGRGMGRGVGKGTGMGGGASGIAGGGLRVGAGLSASARAGGTGVQFISGSATAGGSSSQIISGAKGAGGIASGASGGVQVSRQESYTSQREVTYIPKQGEDPQFVARELVWRVGGASRLVGHGLYTIHAYDIPYSQENGTLNYCWRAKDGDFGLGPFCQVFKAHIPGLYKNIKERNETVSFESLCLPGYYLRQKNYHYVLQKRDGSDLFDKESSFTAYSVMKFTRNIMLQSMHKDWYICEKGNRKSIHEASRLMLDFYNGDPDVLSRCTFLFHPIAQNENKYKMCQNVLGPVKLPRIGGQPLPQPPHLISNRPASSSARPSCTPICPPGTIGITPGQPTNFKTSTNTAAPKGSMGLLLRPAVNTVNKTGACVAVNFVNNVGSPFKLFSSLKHEGYLVTGSEIKLKLIIERPELHSYVTFNAVDPRGKTNILLNEKPSISEPAILGCSVFVNVLVTAEQAHSGSALEAPASPSLLPPASLHPSLLTASPYHHHHHPSSVLLPVGPTFPPAVSNASTQQVTTPKKGEEPKEVHYHYHYHGYKEANPSVCPNTCLTSGECHPTCPSHCCKRNFPEETLGDEGDDDITVA